MSALATSSCDNPIAGAKLPRLTLLAPDIIYAILDNKEPEGMTIIQLYEAIPVLWEEQSKLYGLPAAAC
jgi:hypothetical protein